MSTEELKPDTESVPNLWEITHSVETNASPAFAWHYWTDIANWEDPPAQFELYGPFASGSHGITRLPGQEPIPWHIRDFRPPSAATIEMSLDRAALLFEWRFSPLPGERTRLTQRIVLKGEKADLYLSHVKAAFTVNPLAGMNRLATTMANADPGRKSPASD